MSDLDDNVPADEAISDAPPVTVLDGLLLLAFSVRCKVHDVATMMHLSGLFDVTEPMVESLVNSYSATSLRAFFRATRSKLSNASTLRREVERVWLTGEALRGLWRVQQRGWTQLEASRLVPPARLKSWVGVFGAVDDRMTKLVYEIGALTGVTEDDVDAFLERFDDEGAVRPE